VASRRGSLNRSLKNYKLKMLEIFSLDLPNWFSMKKATTKFTTCIQDLVLRCSPHGTYSGTPTLKQAWKWVKRLMEDYMTLKKYAGGDTDKIERSILKHVMECLAVDEKADIVNKLKKSDCRK